MESRSLSGIRILISNDDGVHAEGIKVLEKIANTITPDVWVVAPEKGQSGKGCSSTFDSILRIQQWGPRKFSVTGTPSDNVHVAMEHILADRKPDLILSGINEDSNVGNYVMLSGTLGAAFAGSVEHVHSIAISQHLINRPAKYFLAEHYLVEIIRDLYLIKGWTTDVVMNVNFPCCQLNEVKGVKITKQADLSVSWKTSVTIDPYGGKCYWLTSRILSDEEKAYGSDVEAIYEDNYISITPLRCDLTDYSSMNILKEKFYDKVR